MSLPNVQQESPLLVDFHLQIFLKNMGIEGAVIMKLIRKMVSVWLKKLKYFNEYKVNTQ